MGDADVSGGLEEVGAASIIGIITAVLNLDIVGLFVDGPAVLAVVLFCAETSELDELDTGRTDRVGPVDRPLGLGDTACDFVEEVGGGNWAVERGDEVGGECVEGLAGAYGLVWRG